MEEEVEKTFEAQKVEDWRAVSLQRHSSLGFGFSMIPGPKNKGACIGVIVPGGPACQELILRTGDRIVAIDGKECSDLPFSTIEQALEAAGATLELEVKASKDSVGEGADDTRSIRSSEGSFIRNGSRESAPRISLPVLPAPSPVATPAAPTPSPKVEGYVDLAQQVFNEDALKEARRAAEDKTKSDAAAKKAPALTDEERARRDAELKKRGYLTEEEIAKPGAPPPRKPAAGSAVLPNLSPLSVSDSDSKPPLSADPSPLRPMTSPGVSRKNTLFFIGPANKDTANAILSAKEDGAFVLRASLNQPGTYALSVKCTDQVHQISISHDAEGFRISRKLAFPSISLLVKHYQENSLENHFSHLKTKLSIPRGSLEFSD